MFVSMCEKMLEIHFIVLFFSNLWAGFVIQFFYLKDPLPWIGLEQLYNGMDFF